MIRGQQGKQWGSDRDWSRDNATGKPNLIAEAVWVACLGASMFQPIDQFPVTASPMPESKRKSYTFLTWNLCLLEKSHQAPANWQLDQAEARVREFILDLDPDFVFFQELPGLVPYVETHDLVPANTITHSGNIATLARHELMESLQSRTVDKFAILTSIRSAGISFANVHLEPGPNGKQKRFASLERLAKTCGTPALLIAGDTNTRTSEVESWSHLGFEGKLPPRATWNSRTNQFRDGDRKYTAYYTRYFHSRNVKVSNVRVWDQPIQVQGKKFHLSDHFAMSGKAALAEKPL